MDISDGFVPITAMFFSVFHPIQGSKVIHQVPNGAIFPDSTIVDSSALEDPLFDFDVIKNYVIPKPSLCNKLVTFKINNYRVLGFPVNIYGSHYARNSFSFNCCFVFPYDSDTTPYEGNLKRIGRMLRALEEQSQLISKNLENSEVYFAENSNSHDHRLPQNNGVFNSKYLKIVQEWDGESTPVTTSTMNAKNEQKFSSIKSLIEQIFQDLNSYSECQIPIDSSNSVDLKLFLIYPPPPKVQFYDVPLALVKLNSLVDTLWDPTMLKIIPFINGIHSVAQIAELSNSDYELTRQCIRHLLHYKSISLLDIFQFSNHYAVTSNISQFLRDPNMATDCQEFIIKPSGTFKDLPIRKARGSEASHDFPVGMSFYKNSSTSISPGSPRKPLLHTLPSGQSTQSALSHHSNNNGNVVGVSGEKILPLPSKAILFQLYRSLNQNISVKQWVIENYQFLENIDIRKFIIFGVLKGIIYRVRSYPIMNKMISDPDVEFKNGTLSKLLKEADIPGMPNDLALNESNKLINEEIDDGEHEDKFYSPDDLKKSKYAQIMELKLKKLISKNYGFDSICTSMKMERNEVINYLDKLGDWEVINC